MFLNPHDCNIDDVSVELKLELFELQENVVRYCVCVCVCVYSLYCI